MIHFTPCLSAHCCINSSKESGPFENSANFGLSLFNLAQTSIPSSAASKVHAESRNNESPHVNRKMCDVASVIHVISGSPYSSLNAKIATNASTAITIHVVIELDEVEDSAEVGEVGGVTPSAESSEEVSVLSPTVSPKLPTEPRIEDVKEELPPRLLEP